jgi:pimeloyl-ACP methyl ester carboxylesterase
MQYWSMRRARLVPEDALPQSDGITAPWPGRSVLLDGARVHVRDTAPRGAGAEPALYVHGLGGSSLNWTDLAGLLADRLDGQAIDLPGFGRSDPARSYTVAAQARIVIRWIEESGRGPVHLFGNSLGGAVAVHAAGTRPDLIRSLTLVSPAMPFLDPRRSFHGRMLPLLLLPRADRFAARRMAAIEPADLARMVIASCFADPTRFPEQRFAEAVEEARLRYTVPGYTTAYVRTLRSLIVSFIRAYLPGSASLWRIARRITAPTLVIGGQRDLLVDVRVAAQVARVIPDSRLLTLHDVGHVAQMEAPRMVARAFLGMLDEATSTQSTTLADHPDRVRPPRRDITVRGGVTAAGEAAL